MSIPGYDPDVRMRCNLSFDGYRCGEVVLGDPVLCRPYLDRGWLSILDDDDKRVVQTGSTVGTSFVTMRAGIPLDYAESAE